MKKGVLWFNLHNSTPINFLIRDHVIKNALKTCIQHISNPI